MYGYEEQTFFFAGTWNISISFKKWEIFVVSILTDSLCVLADSFVKSEILKFNIRILSTNKCTLYYTYKMLKCIVKISRVCSCMFRSTWTILRDLMLSLAKAAIFFVELISKNTSLYDFWCCGNEYFRLCTECCVVWVANYTALNIHTTAWNTCCHNTACHTAMYFYWSIPQKKL